MRLGWLGGVLSCLKRQVLGGLGLKLRLNDLGGRCLLRTLGLLYRLKEAFVQKASDLLHLKELFELLV